MREKLAKNAYSVLNMKSLQLLLGPWDWSESHEQALFHIIWNSYRPNTVVSNTQITQSRTLELISSGTYSSAFGLIGCGGNHPWTCDIGIIRRLIDPLCVWFYGAEQAKYGLEMLYLR